MAGDRYWVDMVVDALVRAGNDAPPAGPVNVGSGQPTDLLRWRRQGQFGVAKPIDRSFGKAIKAIRQRHGWERKEIVERVKTYYRSERNYRRIENGKRTPVARPPLPFLLPGYKSQASKRSIPY